jgi:hypothetical protein
MFYAIHFRMTLHLHMWDDADMFVHVHVQRRRIDPLTFGKVQRIDSLRPQYNHEKDYTNLRPTAYKYQFKINTSQQDWRSCNDPNSYSGGTGIESEPGHRL